MLAPLFGVVAIGIFVSSPGSIFYRAHRMGINRKEFVMYKFRTMHVDQQWFPSLITAKEDPRVFRFGAWLRRSKIDELPQLINVLKGEMSIVGPRPEDPKIVQLYYTPEHLETLSVLPGLASPGSIYNYTHGEAMLDVSDAEECYVEKILPIKLALDIVYVREASFAYDLSIILRTILAILLNIIGRRYSSNPPEIKKIQGLIYSVKYKCEQDL